MARNASSMIHTTLDAEIETDLQPLQQIPMFEGELVDLNDVFIRFREAKGALEFMVPYKALCAKGDAPHRWSDLRQAGENHNAPVYEFGDRLFVPRTIKAYGQNGASEFLVHMSTNVMPWHSTPETVPLEAYLKRRLTSSDYSQPVSQPGTPRPYDQ